MSLESLDVGHHRGIDNKFTYTFYWTQILLILCKRLHEVYLMKILKHQANQVLGQKVCSMCSALDFDTEFPSDISIFKGEKNDSALHRVDLM